MAAELSGHCRECLLSSRGTYCAITYWLMWELMTYFFPSDLVSNN